jgi:hypothetical protein
MTDEELVIEVALTRLDNPGLDLEEIAELVARRMGEDRMLDFASPNLATRGELRAAVFPSAVEHVLRVVLTCAAPSTDRASPRESLSRRRRQIIGYLA